MNDEQPQLKPCFTCRGKGKIQYVIAENSILEHWRIQDCPYCDGTGIAREIPKESHE